MTKQQRPFLQTLDGALNRYMALITPIGLIFGFLLGPRILWMEQAVPFLFAMVTLIGALGMDLSDFKEVLSRPKPILLVLVCSHVLIPLCVWILASLFFGNSPETVMGFVLLSAIPIAVSSYVWCSIYYGKGSLALSIILIDTILAPLLTPLTVRIFTQTDIVFNTQGIMLSLLYMVVIPSILGMVLNHIAHDKVVTVIIPHTKPLSKVFLFLVVMINASLIASRVALSWDHLGIAVLNIGLTVLGFLISYGCSKLMRCSKAEQVTITYSGSMRNLSAALVLAIQYFPPQASIPVVFGILGQQMLASILGKIVFGGYQRKMQAQEA